MAQTDIDLNVYLKAAKLEFDIVSRTLREKGAKRFLVAFLAAGAMVLAAHIFVYAPPKKRLATLDKEIQKRKAMALWGGQYKELRAGLGSAYAILPNPKDKYQWLSTALIESLKAENLTPVSFLPTREDETAGLISQISSVQLTFTFPEFYSWLQRLEAGKPLLHLQSMELSKSRDRVGRNGGNFDVVTVIPRKRYD